MCMSTNMSDKVLIRVLVSVIKNSSKLSRVCMARGSDVPQGRTIPEALSEGGQQARCSLPQTRRRSAGWSYRERCTQGSTGSA